MPVGADLTRKGAGSAIEHDPAKLATALRDLL
jgi:hypothetical protein